MNRQPFNKAFFALLLALLLACGPAITAAAAPPPPVKTIITLVEPGEKELGESFMLMGFLKDVLGHPVPDKNVSFELNGEYLGQAHTTESGIFFMEVRKDLPAREYVLSANFKGAHLLSPSFAVSRLVIHPAIVQVQTVPPVEGISFRMDGRQFFSNKDGLAEIAIFEAGTYRLDAEIEKYSSLLQKVEFGRWSMESYQPFRDVRVPADGVIEVGLDIFHQVGQNFVDLDGKPVDTSRISSLTIRSLQGDVFTFEDGQPRWLPASRTARRMNGLEMTPLLYSVMNVSVDGSNVVNQAQQRFFTKPNDNWEISLLLYSLRVRASDALFGSPVGTGVKLEFPSGETRIYPLDASGVVEISSLARGIYQFEIVGAPGMVTRAPVALSRDQDVNSKVITYLDLGVVGGLGVVVALGLLLFGRPWLLPWIQRVEQEAHPAPGFAHAQDN